MSRWRADALGREEVGIDAALSPRTATANGVSGTSTITVNPSNTAPTIEMTAPSGGAAVLPTSVVTIQWTAMDDVGVTGVDLSYTADGVLEPVAIAADVQGMTYDWTTPDEMLTGVVIKGVAKDAGGLTGEDETADIFAVVQFSDRGYVTGATCGECHPGISREMAAAPIHGVSGQGLQTSAADIVEKIYIIAIVVIRLSDSSSVK